MQWQQTRCRILTGRVSNQLQDTYRQGVKPGGVQIFLTGAVVLIESASQGSFVQGCVELPHAAHQGTGLNREPL